MADPRNVYNHLHTQPDGTVIGVDRNHKLDRVCHISNAAQQRLATLATHARNGDTWTQKGIYNYLQYTWFKQLASSNITYIQAASQPFRERMTAAGLSHHVCVFNTGLVNDDLHPIYLLMVQEMNGAVPYVVREGQVVIATDSLALRLDEILRDASVPHDIHAMGPDLAQWPPAARYFRGRDQRMLLDTELEVRPNALHVVQQRANRFVVAGVLDLDELTHVKVDVPPPGGAVAPHGQPVEQGFQWELLRDEDTFSPHVVKDYNGRERHVYLKQNTGNGTYRFARGAAGMNAFSQRLTEWINEAAQLCRMNYALALPQAYFTKGPAVWQETSQLLLPLYCGKNNTVLALTVLYQGPAGAVDGYYQAFTVLTLRMARQNARLITTPQVLWLADAQ